MLSYFFRAEKTVPIDTQIEAILQEMERIGVAGQGYSELIAYLERLNEVKAKSSHSRVSRDTVAIVAGNLLGILIIVAYEQKHVMTSKGLSQIIRLKGT